MYIERGRFYDGDSALPPSESSSKDISHAAKTRHISNPYPLWKANNPAHEVAKTPYRRANLSTITLFETVFSAALWHTIYPLLISLPQGRSTGPFLRLCW